MACKSSFASAIFFLRFCHPASISQPEICDAADGVSSWIGDGACDPQNNILECQWDGGDCCIGTCRNDYFVCGTDGYLCIDPDAVDEDTYEEITPSPCPVNGKRYWVVENTTRMRALAEAVNCLGGIFQVEVKGSIIVDTEIAIVGGTSLSITGGLDRNTTLDGGNTTRVFRVVNASLQLNDVNIKNGYATFGGAITATDSVLTLNHVNFVHNTAYEKSGGAVFAYGGSSISFSGETAFLNNSSNYDGGALYVVNSSISWEAESSFSENSATNSGGALCAVSGSTVSWAASAAFIGNQANNDAGGALYIEGGSSAFWSADASFVSNDAENDGGAVFINRESNATWNKGAHFLGNTATIGGGGAILVGDSSIVKWSGETSLTSNTCGSQGGALSSRAFDMSTSTSSGNNQRSSLTTEGTLIFDNNTSGLNGGGIAFLGGMSASFSSRNITFSDNKAGGSGGGVFISAPGEGPTFINATFLSNVAEKGGGVFINGCGTYADLTDGELSATFDECAFIENSAYETGGAIEISSGAASVKNTQFKRNIAFFSGGALKTSHAILLRSCIFEENISEMGGGPAIHMIGLTLDMENCSFRGNTYDCDAGTFLDESRGNRFDVVCSGCDECDTCAVETPNIIPNCSTTIEHSSSPGGHVVTLETLHIKRGYWRATSESTTVLACYNEDACEGGKTGSDEYCHTGYTGPYCAVCADDYTKSSAYICTNCSNKGWRISASVVVTAVVIFLALAAFTYLISPMRANAKTGITACLLRLVPVHSLKIIIVTWQILAQFATVTNVTYPGIYQRLMDVVGVLDLDPTWMLSGGCVIDVDFHSRFLIVTIGPILAILMLMATFFYVARRHGTSEEVLKISQHKHVSALLFLLFLVYSSTSSVIFQMFDCDALDDEKIYLRADYTIECDKPRHQILRIWAGFAIIVYPLGIPFFFSFLLFKCRSVLLDKTLRETTLSVGSISDLWKPYRPKRFYYEVIECSRRILITGVMMGSEDDSAAQIAVVLMLALVFTIISESLAPYESHLDAWLNRWGHAVVVFSMYYALLLKVDVSDDSEDSQSVFGCVLVAMHILMVLIVIIEAAFTGYSLKERQVVDPWPRIYRDRSQSFRVGSQFRNTTWRVAHSDNIELSTRTPYLEPTSSTSGTGCDPTVAPIYKEIRCTGS